MDGSENINGTNYNNLNNNLGANTKPPKKKKRHTFLKFLLVIGIIVIIVNLVKLGISIYQKAKFEKIAKENLLVIKEEPLEFPEDKLDEDTNGDGLTNRQKIELKLDLLHDDSDRDGLTDYDEIYKYNSDPKKVSTSGDIYSDGYKVSKGYDINKFYKDSEVINITNNSGSYNSGDKENYINITVDEADDMRACYKEYTGSIPSKYVVAKQPFRIFAFTGKAEIKIDNPKDYEVISYDVLENKDKKISSKKTKDSLIFNIDNDNPIIISYTPKALKKHEKLGDIAIETANDELYFIDDQGKISIRNDESGQISNKKESEYIVLACPLFTYFASTPIQIFEINNLKSLRGNNFKLQELINKKVEEEEEGLFKVNVVYTDTISAKLYDSIFSRFELDFNNIKEIPIINYFILYKHVKSLEELDEFLFGANKILGEYSATAEESVEEDSTEEEEIEFVDFEEITIKDEKYYADSGFKIDVNAFRFENLTTTWSGGGVCAGFAYVTANIYNDGNLPHSLKGSYDMSKTFYDKIWEKNLYSYVPTSEYLKDYADDENGDHKVLNTSKSGSTEDTESVTVDAPDSEVINILNYYWDSLNDMTFWSRFGLSFSCSTGYKQRISEEIIQKVHKELSEGRIVGAFIRDNEGSQHAINIYKMAEAKYSNDYLYLKVYDSNLPNDMFFYMDEKGNISKRKYYVIVRLKRIYEKDFWGNEIISYEFDYEPIKGIDYHYSNLFSGNNGFILFFNEKGETF